MGIFKKRSSQFARVNELGPPDWSRVDIEGEEPVAAGNGWLLGASIGDDLDHPCTVFVTNHSVYVDVRPDTPFAEPQLIEISPYGIEKAGVGQGDRGNHRFVVVYTVKGETKGVAVDIERSQRQFAETLITWSERAARQTGTHRMMLETMAERQRKS